MPTQKRTKQPHLIWLMADQLRFDTLGAYGDQQCPTPNLDAFADQATIFERHFTNCPLSVPARSSIMTGLTPQQHGAVINGWDDADRERGTVNPGVRLTPEYLLDAGYHVAHVGVQHVRAPEGFHERLPDVEFVGPESTAQHFRDLQERGLMLHDTSVLRDPIIEEIRGTPVVRQGSNAQTAVFPLKPDLFYDSVLADGMSTCIQRHAKADGPNSDKPLAMFGMFWLPHPPLVAPERYLEMIDPETIKLPPTTGKWQPGMPAMQLLNKPGQLGAHVSMALWREAWHTYLAMVALFDHCIGRVFRTLEQTGMLDDALVIVTSDHGEMLGSHGMYQKMCLYEPSIRVPMLMRLPGQTRGRRVWEMTDHLDSVATMMDLAGAGPIPNSPGRSLRRLGAGETPEQPPREVQFCAYDGDAACGYQHRMARSSSHKLIHNIGDRAELYDLVEDPRETKNLYGDESLSAVQEELTVELNGWMDSYDDPLPRLGA